MNEIVRIYNEGFANEKAVLSKETIRFIDDCLKETELLLSGINEQIKRFKDK